jgi:amino acid permease
MVVFLVNLIGTAVGPGILGLPAATLHAGLIPSSVMIVAVWAYVMASILLVAELSYAG